jgi:hypothetical protein
MSILTNPSAAFPTSLIYITVGTLLDIWTITSLVYYPPETNWGKFLVVGFLVTGIALLVIGLLLGPIGRAARRAELPPTEVTAAVAEPTADANPPPVVPVRAATQEAPPIALKPTATTIAPTVPRANFEPAPKQERP